MGLILFLGIALLVFTSGQKKTQEGSDADASDLAAYGEALEQRLSSMCKSVVGVGEARVMVTFASGAEIEYKGSAQTLSRPPRVQGVTVLCTGGADSAVRASLSEMLGALLGIGASHICILPLAGG